MKDYRLSEIQNHNWNRLWDLGDDIAKRRLEFEFLRKAQYSLEHLDIEPRDMVELPYKQEIKFSERRSEWQVVWRDGFIQRIRFADFPTEPEADAFLAELKGGKQ